MRPTLYTSEIIFYKKVPTNMIAMLSLISVQNKNWYTYIYLILCVLSVLHNNPIYFDVCVSCFWF